MEQTMTSAISAASSKLRHRRKGFTLIELLVVIGILALLVGILTPMVMRSWRNSKRARVAMDFQAISSALESYRSAFGDYPRVPMINPSWNTTDINRPNPSTGAQILCQALIAPAPKLELPTPAATDRPKQDGADGPGFRLRGTSGQVYGPFLEPSKFKIGDPDDPSNPAPNPLKAVLIDVYNSPILYYPTNPGKPDVHITDSYVFVSNNALVNAGDNLNQMGLNGLKAFEHTSGDILVTKRIQAMLGDFDYSGEINGTETSIAVGHYILWSSGPDEVFGPNLPAAGNATQSDVDNCDDITTFKQ